MRPQKTLLIMSWASEVATVYFSGKLAVVTSIIIIMIEIRAWKQELANLRAQQRRKLNQSYRGIMQNILMNISLLVGKAISDLFFVNE